MTVLGPGTHGGEASSLSRVHLDLTVLGLRNIGGISFLGWRDFLTMLCGMSPVPVTCVPPQTLHLCIICPVLSLSSSSVCLGGQDVLWAVQWISCLSVVSPQASCVTAVHPVSSAPVLTGHRQSWLPLTASSPYSVSPTTILGPQHCHRGRPPAHPVAPSPALAWPEDCAELTLWFLRCSPVPVPGPGREKGFWPALGEALEDLESCGQSELLRELEVPLPLWAWGRVGMNSVFALCVLEIL